MSKSLVREKSGGDWVRSILQALLLVAVGAFFSSITVQYLCSLWLREETRDYVYFLELGYRDQDCGVRGDAVPDGQEECVKAAAAKARKAVGVKW